MASVAITGSSRTTAVSGGPPPQTDRDAQGDPLVPRMLLARRLRALREEGRFGRRHAAAAIGGSESKISRLEQGRTGGKAADIEALLTLYGVADDERATLLALAERTHARPWWHADRDIVPGWTREYLSAEQAAKLVRTFEAQYVPGLMQTEGYARALIGLLDLGEQETERRVRFRMERQRILRRRPRPLNLWVVLDEAALWRPIGDPEMMRDQIRHIIELCRRPNVTVQIAPLGICRRVAGDGPLTLIRFPQQGLTDMVYLERDDAARYPVGRAEIERHWHVFNTLVTEASPPEHTPRHLAGLLGNY